MWHFLKVCIKKKERKKNLGTLPTHGFCLERTILPMWGMEQRCNLLAFQKLLQPQNG